jgi:YegS/Rv2252/BmrU family lipid kinase
LVGTDTALGIVPRGSGNALAREFGVPLDLDGALRVVAEGVPRRVDVAEVNGRRFLSTFGTGLDARVVRRYEREAGKVRGLLPYVVTGIKEFLTFRPTPVRLQLAGRSRELRPLLLVIANARMYGGGAVVAPNARMDDGLLDMVYVPPVGLLRGAYYTLKLFAGTLHRGSRVQTMRADSLELDLPEGTAVQLDGEPMTMGGHLSVRCLPSSLLVWVPA